MLTNITVPIDLDQYLADYRQTSEDDFEATPITVEDIIIRSAGNVLASSLTREDRADVRRKVQERTLAAIDAAIADKALAAVQAFMDTPRTPTDTWGNPKGDPVTFGEMIDQRVEVILTKRHTNDRFSKGAEGTIVEQAIAAAVKDSVAKQVKAAVEAERDAVVAKVAASAAAVLTEGMKRAASL